MKLFSRRASSAALQKDKQYKEFIRHNEAKGWNNERLAGEKGRVYAVATDEGVLFFSDSEKGMKVRNSYLQHLADYGHENEVYNSMMSFCNVND